MYGILLVIHVIVAIVLVGLILIQHGKGAQTGAAFGSGASQTVFGSQGSGGFLSRATGILAALFFIINLSLVFLVTKSSHQSMTDVPTVAPASAPEKTKNAGTDVPEIEE